jgi:hypothetical protein
MMTPAPRTAVALHHIPTDEGGNTANQTLLLMPQEVAHHAQKPTGLKDLLGCALLRWLP